MARVSVLNAPWTGPSGDVPGVFLQEETPGKTQATTEGFCHSAGLGTPWDPPRRAGGRVQIQVWVSLLRLPSPR